MSATVVKELACKFPENSTTGSQKPLELTPAVQCKAVLSLNLLSSSRRRFSQGHVKRCQNVSQRPDINWLTVANPVGSVVEICT